MTEKCRKSRVKLLLRIGFLTAVITLMVLVGVVLAGAEVYSGECGAEGDNVTWTLDTETGVLEISGVGKIKDFSSGDMPGWFSYLQAIRDVNINSGVTYIGDRAFMQCTSIENVSIPEGVKGLGRCAFYNCNKLKSIAIPYSVSTIENECFERCNRLESIVIHKNVKNFGVFIFRECKSLSSVIIEDGVQCLGDGMFSGCKYLKQIIIPPSIKEINSGLFYDCIRLEDVQLPDTVTRIGNSAFYNCYSLKRFTFPKNIQIIEGSAFACCDGFTNINIPEGVSEINHRLFIDCTNLSSISIPVSVTHINDGAFWHCDKLTDVYYLGTKSEWETIIITKETNTPLLNATIHFLGEPTEIIYHLDPTTGLWLDDNGTPAQGLVQCDDGKMRYCIDGVPQYAGAVADDEGYVYYINSSTKASVQGKVYYVTKNNGLVPSGYYTVDDQGRLMDGRGDYVMADTAMNDGLKFFADGSVVYCENGVRKSYAGLIGFEGDYYYIGDYAKPVAGKTYYITRTNGLTLPDGTPIPKGTYEFDGDGKMKLVIKNGFIDGVYYENNLPKSYAGLIEFEGNYYYIADNAKPITGKRHYVLTPNGLLPKGWYDFDESGVLILP